MSIYSNFVALLAGGSLSLFALTSAQAGSSITLAIAGEAFDGAPGYEMRLGDKIVAYGQLTKAIDTVAKGRLFFDPAPDSYIEHFEISIDDEDFDPTAPIEIILTNDRFKQEGWGRDRNLFVHSIEINGLIVRAAGWHLETRGQREKVDYQAGFLPVYNGDQKAVAPPPAGGWPLPATARSPDRPFEAAKSGS